MTDAPDDGQAPDGIEEGKRLIRVGSAGGLSLAERLAERFHRLTWATPFHAMRLKGRYPLKLIAVPDDPLLGDVRQGRALLAGSVSHRGETRAIAAIDFARPDWSPAMADYLHSFVWLRDLSTVATRAAAAPVAETLTARWLDAHADKVGGAAWRPDAWGRRILHWSAHAPLILSSTDLVYRSRLLNALARGSRHLDRGADKAAAGVPRIAAWCGVVAAGLLIPGGEARLAHGEAGLARALAGGVTPDGGAVSRSPVALADTVALIAALRECYAARRMELPPVVAATLARAVPALLGVLAADRGLGSWQGGVPLAPDRVAALIDASGVRTRPLRQARDWGYQRLAAGGAVLVVDAAPPPAGATARGACASTLAFELSDGPARIVVNCGGGAGAVHQLPAAIVQGLRTTAAHSTLVLADTNSTAIHADGSLGRGVGEIELSRQESEAGSRIDAAHDGYLRRWGLRHRRQLMLAADGRELRGEDQLLPDGRRRRTAAAAFAVRFHLGAGVEASPTADGMAAILRLPAADQADQADQRERAALWQFRCRGGVLSIEESLWIDGDGRPVPTQQLVVSGEAAAGGASISWALKRAV